MYYRGVGGKSQGLILNFLKKFLMDGFVKVFCGFFKKNVFFCCIFWDWWYNRENFVTRHKGVWVIGKELFDESNESYSADGLV